MLNISKGGRVPLTGWEMKFRKDGWRSGLMTGNNRTKKGANLAPLIM